MKKRAVRVCMVVGALLAVVCALAGCGESGKVRLRYAATDGGRLVGEAVQVVETGGAGAQITAEAAEGYVFMGWSDGVKEPTRSEKDVTGNLNVTAQFLPQSEAVFDRVYRANQGGNIVGQAAQSVPYGKDAAAVTALPDTGYVFAGWSDGVDTPERTDLSVKEAGEVTAYFDRAVYEVRYYADRGGTIVGNTSQSVYFEADATPVVAVPTAGYRFVGWSDGVDSQQRTDLRITGAISVTALFEKIRVTVEYRAGEGGNIVTRTSVTVEYGGNASAQAEAIPGYEFMSWSDGVTTPARLDENLTEDKYVTAYFGKIHYSVAYLATSGGRVSGNSNQSVYHGGAATPVTAQAYDGFFFVGWSDGVKEATRLDTDITGAKEVTAVFESAFSGGTGSRVSPFLIETLKDFENISLFDTAEHYYLLTGDLDFTGVSYAPAFGDENPFSGFFDGGGFAVKNLTIEAATRYPSLFGRVGTAGTLANLRVKNALIRLQEVESTARAGILCGYSEGNLMGISVSGRIAGKDLSSGVSQIGGLAGTAQGKVTNCRADVSVEIENVKSLSVIGGLIGWSSGDVVSCAASGTVRSTDGEVGGLIGVWIPSDMNGTVASCRASVDIVATKTAAGLINTARSSTRFSLMIVDCAAEGNVEGSKAAGFLFSAATPVPVYLDDCIASGNVIGSESYGFAGRVMFTTMTRCGSTGDVTGYEAYGFIHTLNRSNLDECFSTGTVRADWKGVGFIRSMYGTMKNCYASGDVVITGAEQDREWIALGFIDMLPYTTYDSSIENCYSSGRIVLPETPAPEGSRIAAFMGNAAGTIANCHVLNHQGDGADLAIGTTRDEAIVDLTEYAAVSEMAHLAARLNAGAEEPVWESVEGGLPRLIFQR